MPGLKEKYGVDLQVVQGPGRRRPLTLHALTSDQVQAANLFTTDPAIAAERLVVLQDPKNLFAAQNVVPLIRADKASDTITAR